MLTADAADSMAVELLIAVNPDGDSRLPYLLRIPQPGGDRLTGRSRRGPVRRGPHEHHLQPGNQMTGDLFASGTISGPEKEQRGAFIELSWGGTEPVVVGQHKRTFLADGDTKW